jgi:hypothetical protein
MVAHRAFLYEIRNMGLFTQQENVLHGTRLEKVHSSLRTNRKSHPPRCEEIREESGLLEEHS